MDENEECKYMFERDSLEWSFSVYDEHWALKTEKSISWCDETTINWFDCRTVARGSDKMSYKTEESKNVVGKWLSFMTMNLLWVIDYQLDYTEKHDGSVCLVASYSCHFLLLKACCSVAYDEFLQLRSRLNDY